MNHLVLDQFIDSPWYKFYAQERKITKGDIVLYLSEKLQKGDITQELYDKAVNQLDLLIEKALKGEGK